MMKHGVALTQSALAALDGQKHLLLKTHPLTSSKAAADVV